MDLRIADITEEPLPLEQTLVAAWLDQVLEGGHQTGFGATRDECVSGRVQRVGLDILVQVSFDLKLRTECSRCLEVFETETPVAFRLTFKPKPRQVQAQLEDLELRPEDLEEAWYEGDTIVLDEIVREQILLALPMNPRCSETCRGLCPICGTDLNRDECHCDRGEIDPRLQALKTLIQK